MNAWYSEQLLVTAAEMVCYFCTAVGFVLTMVLSLSRR
jgi:hypothetical protein